MSKQVIGFHYTLKDNKGNLIDSSEGQTPLFFLEGSGNIIPGLEGQILNLNIGDKKQVMVPASEAYGDVINDLIITVARTQFPPEAKLELGDRFKVNEDPDAPVFTVTKLEGTDVVIDGNHPLAGVDLYFDVEITHRRVATAEEISHGHAHGAEGGAHHH